jgi:hypothetical protein
VALKKNNRVIVLTIDTDVQDGANAVPQARMRNQGDPVTTGRTPNPGRTGGRRRRTRSKAYARRHCGAGPKPPLLLALFHRHVSTFCPPAVVASSPLARSASSARYPMLTPCRRRRRDACPPSASPPSQIRASTGLRVYPGPRWRAYSESHLRRSPESMEMTCSRYMPENMGYFPTGVGLKCHFCLSPRAYRVTTRLDKAAKYPDFCIRLPAGEIIANLGAAPSQDCVALCHQVRARVIDKSRLEQQYGKLSLSAIPAVQLGLSFVFNI